MMDTAAVVLRAIDYAALLTAAGIALARLTLRWPETTLNGARQLLLTAALLLIFAELAATAILFVRLGGTFDVPVIGAIAAPPIGPAIALQIGGGLLLLAGGNRPLVGAVGAVTAIGSVCAAGHAATAGWPAVVAVGLHVALAAWWTGCLWLLLAAARHEELAALVRRFSAQATMLVGLLVMAGIAAGALLLDFTIDLSAEYDRTLILKASLVAFLLVLAAANKWLLTPRLAGSGSGASLLRRSILAELALIGSALAVTAYLTTQLSPRPPGELPADHFHPG